jgi:hypothetical protein
MIKKMLILSATVASCYAMEEVADSTLTNASDQPVVVSQQGEDETIEGGAGTYPKSVETKSKPRASWFLCFSCSGCGSVSDASNPKDAPQEFSGISRSESLAAGEGSAGDSDSGGSYVTGSEIAATVEAPAVSGNFFSRLFNWGQKQNTAAKAADTVVSASQQDVAPVEDATNAGAPKAEERDRAESTDSVPAASVDGIVVGTIDANQDHVLSEQ